MLFGLFINNLAIFIKSLYWSVKSGSENVRLLLYADDVAIMAGNHLQFVLDAWYERHKQWSNGDKRCGI